MHDLRFIQNFKIVTISISERAMRVRKLKASTFIFNFCDACRPSRTIYIDIPVREHAPIEIFTVPIVKIVIVQYGSITFFSKVEYGPDDFPDDFNRDFNRRP